MSGITNRLRLRGRQTVRLVLLLILFTSGCSGSGEPPISDANQLFIQASEFIAAGQKDKALEALNQSIAAEPAVWSYRERARLHGEMGNDQAAIADCEAALQLAPDDPDVLWLKGELAKPATQRFQGRFKMPPSSNR